MSENTDFGFAKFVPGFDFLQNIAKGAPGMPQLPHVSSWIAPTLDVKELDKRIGELKAVHFWLEQNGKALGATIQALEVQKMTLATLQGMNFDMGEVADALKFKTPKAPADAARQDTQPARKPAAKPKAAAKAATSGNGAAAAVDPLQWWGALTEQFQQIASSAMQDVAQQVPAAKAAPASAAAAKKTAARKPAPRKARGKA